MNFTLQVSLQVTFTIDLDRRFSPGLNPFLIPSIDAGRKWDLLDANILYPPFPVYFFREMFP